MASADRMLRRRLARRAAAAGVDLDDVVQDALLGILERQRSERSRFDPGRGMSPTSYLYLAGMQSASNSLRRSGRRRPELLTFDGQVPDGPASAEEDADRVMAAAVSELSSYLDLPEEREMLLYLAAGTTLSEIARAMKLSRAAASELRTRVRALVLPARGG